MFSVFLDSAPADREFLLAELAELETLGVVEGDAHVQAFFADETGRDQLAARFAARHPEFLEHAPEDWEQRTREAWPPREAGPFFIVAPWRSEPTPPGMLRLVVNPAMASGTGDHPCTRLCLEALARFVEPGMKVLDVGTGSGILARGAELLGAGMAAGCDIDFASVQQARETARGPLIAGTASAFRSGVFDLVVANLGAGLAEQELPGLTALGRRVILSGFHELEEPWPSGWVEDYRSEADGWVCVSAERDSRPA